MKKYLLTSALSILSVCFLNNVSAQVVTASDQNPNYMQSRDKYMRIADSINQWHGTTIQQTYKAYDWYEQKMERRQLRRDFRREIRMERARHHSYYRPYYYNNHYRSPYRNYYFWWY